MKRFAILLALLPLAASAATITVNSKADNTTASDRRCTLREAIANVNVAGDTSGGELAQSTGPYVVDYQMLPETCSGRAIAC